MRKTIKSVAMMLLATLLTFGVLAGAANTDVYAADAFSVTYDANGGSFEGGGTTNVVTYSGETTKGDVTKYLHTPNVDYDGVKRSSGGVAGPGGYSYDSITIDGAPSLNVTLKHYCANSRCGIYVMAGVVTNTTSPIYSSTSASTTTKTLTVSGPSLTIGKNIFSGQSSYVSSYYYAATISGSGNVPVVATGNYVEPTPVNDEYSFVCWNTAADGSGDDIYEADVRSGMTLYAKYAWTGGTKIGTVGGVPYRILNDGTLVIGDGTECSFDSSFHPSKNSDNANALNDIGYNWPWRSNASVKSVRFEGTVHAPNSIQGMFYGCSGLTDLSAIDWTNFDTSNTTNTSYMFYNCSGLTNNDVHTLNTSNAVYMQSMFCYCTGLTSFDFSKVNTSHAEDLNRFIANCNKITSVDLSTFNVSSAKNLSGLLSSCTGLTSVDLSQLSPTSQVTDFSRLLQYDSNLTSVNLDGLDTSSATDMQYMFASCSKLTTLDVAQLNVSNVTNMEGILQSCSALTDVDFTGWNTSNVTNFSYAFQLASVPNLDLSMLDFRNAVSVSNMLLLNDNLVTVGDNFNWPNATTNDLCYVKPTMTQRQDDVVYNINTGEMFTFDEIREQNGLPAGTYSVEHIPVVVVDSQGNAVMIRTRDELPEYLSKGVRNGRFSRSYTYDPAFEVTITDIDGNSYTGMVFAGVGFADGLRDNNTDHGFFGYSQSNYSGLYTDYNNWIKTFRAAQPVTIRTMAHMFEGCRALQSVDFTNVKYDGSYSTSAKSMFEDAKYVSVTGTEGIDFTKVTDTSRMFYQCSFPNRVYSGDPAAQPVVLSWVNTSNTTNMTYMFYKASGAVVLDSLPTSRATNMSYMFTDATIYGTDFGGWDVSKATNMNYMFSSARIYTNETSAKANLDVSSWNLNTSSALTMSHMFDSCKTLKNYDFSNWNTSRVTDMSCMFRYVTPGADVTLNLHGWDTSRVTNMSGMFAYFGNQATGSNIDISTFNTSSVTNMHEMFRDIALVSKSLDLSHFNTTSVRDFGGMFYDAASYAVTTSSTTYKPREFAIEELDISGFSTSEARYNNTSSGSGYVYGLNNMFGPHTDGINGGGTGTSGHHLKRVKLGTSFNFKGGSYLANYSNYWAKLQTPTGGATNGKWRMEENPEISATPEELQANYYDNRNDYAGWWIWDLGDNCEIVFNPNGGTTTAESIITDQADYPITMPDETTTTRPGYDLIGWNTNPDGETRSPNYLPGETYTDVVRQGQQVILYAQWEYTGMYHYKIQYYQQSLYNEWNYSLVETKQYKGLVGTLIEPQIVEYPGFVYDRMSPAESKVITEDEKAQVAMYYIREYYTVHFDGNGAESGSIQDMKCMINRDYVIPENVFSYPGHLPVGWNTEPDGSGMFITNGAQFVNLCENHLDEITLYAQWLDNENPEMTPTEGKIRVKIKAGQTIVFPDLPAGTTYEIEEIGMGPGWSFDYSDGAQGEIYSNDVSSSNFYNHYDAEGTVNFTIWKEIVGWQTGAQKPIEEGQFTFAMFANNGWNNWQVDTVTNGAVDENEYIFDNEGNEIPNPHYGMAPVEFSYEFGTNDIGADYTFYIGELGEDPMYEADGQVIAHVHVEDGGQGALVFDVTYENTVEGKEDPQVITNTDLNGSDLYIYKNVTGTVPEGVDTEFSFKVELYDAEGRTLTDTVDAAVYDLESGDRVRAIELTAGDTVKMKPTEYISMTLPWGTQYKVTEADKDGWTLVQKSNTEGQIPSGEYTETHVAFTNAYDVDGTVEIPVTKTMIGRELTAGEFTFYILDEEGQTVASTVNDANGNATMAIAYSTEDVGQTYHYTVHEMKPDVMADASVIYDETVYNVDVEVVLNNGVLGGNITINGGEADSISFTNRYVAETSLTINGDKTLEGREFRESDAWTFTLTGDGPLPENSSVEIHPFTDATFSFTIPFSTLDLDGGTEKEFTYHVKESGFVPLIANDKTDWTFTVKVVDDSQGHLTAMIVDGPETMTFTNRALVTLPATGSTMAIWVMLAGIAVIAAGIWYSRKRKGELAE